MKADLLRTEFAADAVPAADGRLLLAPNDALALIGRAAEEGVPIVRVRGVADARPDDASAADAADFAAAVAEGHGCWEDAERFVRAHGGGAVAFELTLGDDPVEVV